MSSLRLLETRAACAVAEALEGLPEESAARVLDLVRDRVGVDDARKPDPSSLGDLRARCGHRGGASNLICELPHDHPGPHAAPSVAAEPWE